MQEEKLKAVLAKMVPLFEKVEKLLVQNNGGNGFFTSKVRDRFVYTLYSLCML